MNRHFILEGKPTTGKTEISNLFKIFFPGRVIILPELTTVLVREHKLKILEDRVRLNDLLVDAVPARKLEVEEHLQDPGVVILEESHMGVHWAYSRILGDQYFLDLYEQKIAEHQVVPDMFVRLDIPVELSVKRQRARATKDVEVDGDLVRRTFAELDAWHEQRGHDNLVLLDSDRSPDQVIRDLMTLMGVEYGV